MAYLIIYTADAPAQKMRLTGPAVVGRAMGSDLWLDDRKLSREHCRIEPRGKGWVLIDMNSTNGTFVHRKRIKKHALVEGDTFEVGKASVVFREGDFVDHRPADPIEAASMGPRKSTQRKQHADPGNTTVVGQRLPQVRVTVADELKPKRRPGEVALPFRRPPAKPMVKDSSPTSEGPAEQSSRWFNTLTSRLRGR
jgi:predicted component of type VI protein secretion system